MSQILPGLFGLQPYQLVPDPLKALDIEVEEYVDELEGFAESFSDEDHVEEEGVYSDEMNINIAEIDVEESAGPYA
ncbi:hypothetical protein T01_9908 [Trichinella spiralis]|uniref:Uncharacterized protein n=1 Tax=Trichinella spiralis TaxID=6334 RepID=A0A0V1BYK9_TRISP|nr:hypothetical protein T01_9908 [Trichinella spiralis]